MPVEAPAEALQRDDHGQPTDVAAGLMWYGMTLGAYAAMSGRERQELLEWERANVNGETVATSDWPGWSRYLPPKPIMAGTAYAKTPIPKALRLAVLERDAYRCQHCGARTKLCVDHIHPESKGGRAIMANLQVLCRSCNLKKGASMP